MLPGEGENGAQVKKDSEADAVFFGENKPMQPHRFRLIKTIAAFVFAPLAAVAVIFLFMLLGALAKNNISDAIGGALAFSFTVYLFYLFGLVLILPAYLLLRCMKKDSQLNLTLLGGGFGLLVGLLLFQLSWGGIMLGLILGLPSGYLLSIFIAKPPVNWQSINLKQIGMALIFVFLFFVAGFLTTQA